MRSVFLKSALVLTVVLSWSGVPAAGRASVDNGVGPTFKAIGPLAFSPDGVLFAGDTQSAAILALDLGKAATGGAPGAASIPAFDQKVAALLGTDVREVTVTDLVVHPKTRNAFASVMRGQGNNAQPALLRIDGAGKIDVVAFGDIKFSRVELPNAPAANPSDTRNARTQSITDMAFVDGKLYVAGLSNEEFSSKLRSVSYPFAAVDNGTSVEIYHGAHGRFETRAPVRTLVPITVGSEPYVLAAYTCTPLVQFPVKQLQPGAKIRGKTIAELGNQNRPLDMIVYEKDGKDYLLLANSSRGVMKIPTDSIEKADDIQEPVRGGGHKGLPFETVEKWTGVQHLDKLDAQNALVLRKGDGNALTLEALALP